MNVLDFDVTNYVEEWAWGEVRKDGVSIMFAVRDCNGYILQFGQEMGT